MKVRIKDVGDDNSKSWVETWKESSREEGESDEAWARRTIDEFNQYVRPGQKTREFVEIVVDPPMTPDQITEANNLVEELGFSDPELIIFAADSTLDLNLTDKQYEEDWISRDDMYKSLTEPQAALLIDALRERVVNQDDDDDEDFDDEDEEDEDEDDEDDDVETTLRDTGYDDPPTIR